MCYIIGFELIANQYRNKNKKRVDLEEGETSTVCLYQFQISSEEIPPRMRIWTQCIYVICVGYLFLQIHFLNINHLRLTTILRLIVIYN